MEEWRIVWCGFHAYINVQFGGAIFAITFIICKVYGCDLPNGIQVQVNQFCL